MLEDTICAPATPPVNSSIAIIRISGPESIRAVDSLFDRSHRIEPRQAVYGSIVDNKKKIDDVILTYYKSPASFTGEDMVEIFCHGNQIIVHRILKLLNSMDIRLAEPGEFSKRGFLNGKMDLTEAEAINHVITARSEWEVDTAIKQMHGSMREAVDHIRDNVILLKADIEAAIDFIEEDIEFVSQAAALEKTAEIGKSIDDMLLRCRVGEKISRGIDVTIAGKPNVGKSSILNLILNQERAIVSDIPGTTRDLIKESVQMKGVQVNFVDTAGIEDPRDELEKIGIELSHKNIKSASIVLMILDASTGISDLDREIIDEVSGKKTIFVINKTDLVKKDEIDLIVEELGRQVVMFSAKKGTGLKDLENGITDILENEFVEIDNSFIADIRIINLLEKALQKLARSSELIRASEPPEITAFEFQSLLDNLSDITGEITPDDVLGSIFSRFCIGK